MRSQIKQTLRKNWLIRWLYLQLTLNEARHPKTIFVILAKYRVGSNYLADLLRSHQQIEMHGELFSLTGLIQDIFRITHPKTFVREFCFSGNTDCDAKGFKLMYHHLSDKELKRVEWPPYISERIERDIETVNKLAQLSPKQVRRRCDNALKFLISQKAFRVIHLKRRNLLDTLVSTKRAFMEDKWIHEPYSQRSIELSVPECEAFFVETTAEQEYYTTLFADCPTVDIYYEDLVQDVEGSLSKLQHFLRVREESLCSAIKKQGTHDRKGVIENYDVLKDYFADSRWSSLFEDV